MGQSVVAGLWQRFGDHRATCMCLQCHLGLQCHPSASGLQLTTSCCDRPVGDSQRSHIFEAQVRLKFTHFFIPCKRKYVVSFGLILLAIKQARTAAQEQRARDSSDQKGTVVRRYPKTCLCWQLFAKINFWVALNCTRNGSKS